MGGPTYFGSLTAKRQFVALLEVQIVDGERIAGIEIIIDVFAIVELVNLSVLG